MSVRLSGEQLAKLKEAVDARDRIAYYSLLADFGDVYGELALAVVNNDRGGGATANYFITTQAQIEGNPLSSDELATISIQLMQQDFAVRFNANGAELGYEEIQRYHQQVFSTNGLTASAWTANFPLNFLDTIEEKQQLWATLINSGSLGSAASIVAALGTGWLNKDPSVIAYLGKLASAGSRGLFASSNEFGNYSVAIASGGRAIGGTENNDSKSGTRYADVLMGFDGADKLVGGKGADRLYGGAGNDIIAGGNLDPEFDLSSLDYRKTAHPEWDDSERDILVGGGGSDVYIVGGGVNIVNIPLTPEQLRAREKLDLIDGAKGGFTVHSQWDTDVLGTKSIISGQLTSADLASPTRYNKRTIFETARATVYYPEYKLEVDSVLGGEKVYDAVSKESILYIFSPVASYLWPYLFGIKNFVSFDPRSNVDGWLIEGNDDGNPDLEGTNGDDTVFGRGGDDFIDAAKNGGGSDRYDGGDGNDTISYGASEQNLAISYDNQRGEFSVIGSAGESDKFTNIERIISGSGNDTIAGSNGDETFAGGGGNDEIHGGGGVNALDYSMHTSSVTVRFTTKGVGTVVGSQSGKDTFTGIQNITGSQGDDIITGDSGDNVIDGQNGSDQIDGGDGYDVVSYSDSIDAYTIISAANGYLQVWNYAYSDVVVNVEAFSFAGVKFLRSVIVGASVAWLYGTDAGDNLIGSSNSEAIFGGNGNDTISGLAGNDLIYGADGDDIIFAGEGTNNINGGDGIDTVVIMGARKDFKVTVQKDKSILVTGDGISNRIAGVERIVFDAPGNQEDITLDAANYIASNSETTIAGSTANDNLTGTVGQDTIHGLGGNDTILGLDGDDIIDGGVGDDTIFAGVGTNKIEGGDGTDTVVIEGSFNNFIVSVRNDKSVIVSGEGAFNTITGVENIFFDAPAGQNDKTLSVNDLLEANSQMVLNGTSGADKLTGNAGKDTIFGFEGDDMIVSLGGDDIVDAGAGDDVIFAGTGTNVVDGRAGLDTVVVEGSREEFRLQVVNNSELMVVGKNLMTNIRNAEWIVFDAPEGEQDIRIDAVRFLLDSLTKTLEGTPESETLTGGASIDTVRGRGGDDILYGLGGDDFLQGDEGNDTYVYEPGQGHDIILEVKSQGSADILKLTGRAFSDVNVSRQGSDLLIVVPQSAPEAGDGGSILIKNTLLDDDAGVESFVFTDWTYSKADIRSELLSKLVTSGNDVIEGFDNTADYLEGGAGNDTFVFKPNFGWDTIGDFVAGAGTEDVIEFQGGIFADFEAVLAAASQVGNDTVINVDGTHGITVANVNLSDLHRDDVRLVA